MPAIKIELLKGKEKSVLHTLMDAVMDAVVESLKLPADDRNIRLLEYEPGYFSLKPPYQLIIEISMFSGRTPETKKKLFQNIVEKIYSKNLFEKQEVFIILNEQPMENWGVRGGIPASEIDLRFKVNI
ncbi:MAG: tautomerase family protein [Bacteroidales bacterium]|nr:tautomerase family protein [Bacteroidales bacterium]